MPKNRNLRVTALAQAIAMAQYATLNPFATMADAERLGDQLRTTINAILDSEYQQGYADGAEFTTRAVERMLKEHR